MSVKHSLPHWNYYRLLEQDLEDSFRYVHFCRDHFDVYSDHFARIILTAATEIENVLYDFAVWSKYTPTPKNIVQHFDSVTARFPSLPTMQMVMPRYSLMLTPFEGWSSGASPEWWSKGYNKIKHERTHHPDAPKLIYATRAVAALQVILLHYYRVKFGACTMPAELMPRLFHPWDIEDQNHGAFIGWEWELPDEKLEREQGESEQGAAPNPA
ncbi:MAG: hypothetical protein P1U86_10685 [Verrucomicrobiales bacterium]|nr:hypothetical protein [Verrucomicrobiales bacterium]